MVEVSRTVDDPGQPGVQRPRGLGPRRGRVDRRFSDELAAAASWEAVTSRLTAAEIYWLSTVRPDGRPHTTPLIGVWHDEVLDFCTGPSEQKARNLRSSAHCTVTTGTNSLNSGMDIVLEGPAQRCEDETELTGLAALYRRKYGADWQFDVRDGAFRGQGDIAWVFRVRPAKVLAFSKGSPFAQTVWRA